MLTNRPVVDNVAVLLGLKISARIIYSALLSKARAFLRRGRQPEVSYFHF